MFLLFCREQEREIEKHKERERDKHQQELQRQEKDRLEKQRAEQAVREHFTESLKLANQKVIFHIFLACGFFF